VIKSTSDWNWCPSSVTFTPKTSGSWTRYAVPISSFAASDSKTMNLAEIKQILIQFTSSAEYKGTIYVDNVRSKKGSTETVISDFNRAGSTWAEYENGTADNIQISLAQKPTATSISTKIHALPASGLKVTAVGRNLIITKANTMAGSVRIIDLMGKVLFTQNILKNSGTYSVDCSKLASGSYLTEVIQGNTSQINSITLQ
jgi:hypothetical protein